MCIKNITVFAFCPTSLSSTCATRQFFFRLWLIPAFLPGLDRVSGGAEKPALSGLDHPAGQEHLLSSTFPLYPVIHVHSSHVISFCSGKLHRCSVAEQTGHRELRFSWEGAGVHSRGGTTAPPAHWPEFCCLIEIIFLGLELSTAVPRRRGLALCPDRISSWRATGKPGAAFWPVCSPMLATPPWCRCPSFRTSGGAVVFSDLTGACPGWSLQFLGVSLLPLLLPPLTHYIQWMFQVCLHQVVVRDRQLLASLYTDNQSVIKRII